MNLRKDPLPWDNATSKQILRDLHEIGTKMGHNMSGIAKWGKAEEKPLEIKVWSQTMAAAGMLEAHRVMLLSVEKKSEIHADSQPWNQAQAKSATPSG